MHIYGPTLLIEKWQLCHDRSVDNFECIRSSGLSTGAHHCNTADQSGHATPFDRR
jgi:hypothetical protein